MKSGHPLKGSAEMSGRRNPAGREAGMERRGGGEAGGPARREQEGVAESLLDIADEMEEQGRDLLRQARNLQRIAERMSRRPGQTRGESSRRGEGSSSNRGASSRGAPSRSRGGGERGADRDQTDEWETVGSRTPRKAGGTAKPAGRSGGGGGDRSKRPQGKKKPDWVPGKKGGKKS
jgi:hypothetical protein